MAEFQEVIKQFKRMCSYYQGNLKCPMGCPMNGVNISQCRKILVEQPEITEKTVMAWAAEHPEPVYPTWAEWLHDNGIILDTRQYDEVESWILGIEAMKPIPADIAQKLGLEPKEVR